ncbi:MAG: hypothetical protein PF588_07035 [Candidatus Kapabacteria bacterium]|jgi:hypothetical protein|nr:hypothetical protein [Candidatus Kapabacteria bacterium]
MKNLILLLVMIVGFLSSLQAQDEEFVKINTQLDSIEAGLILGEKQALRDLAVYLDDRNPIIKYNSNSDTSCLAAPISIIAVDILHEYTNFETCALDYNLSKEKFAKYLDEKWNRIYFNKYIGKFTDIDSAQIHALSARTNKISSQNERLSEAEIIFANIFKQICSENDSLAIEGFFKLTEADTSITFPYYYSYYRKDRDKVNLTLPQNPVQ